MQPERSGVVLNPLNDASPDVIRYNRTYRMTHTVQLESVAGGDYWISILEDESGKLVCPRFGPFRREKVFHNLLLVGLDDVQAEFLTEMADLNVKARIKGITPKEYPED